MNTRSVKFVQHALAQELPFSVADEVVASLYGEEGALLAKLEPYGVATSEEHRAVLTVLAEKLLGEPWPATLGEWKTHRRSTFFAKLQEGHTVALRELQA